VEIRTGWIQAQEALMAGIEKVPSPEDIDPRLNTALDLYLSSYYETSLRACFLTLMTVLEVLAPIIEKHVTAVILITKLHKAIKGRLASKVDDEERDALEALQRELDFRKETSIRRRIRRLVLDRAPLDDVDRRTLANNVRDAYDLRGSVVHGNPIDPEHLSSANEIALRAVKLLLRSSLGFAVAPLRSGGDCSEQEQADIREIP
jgi:hypothetical protein